MDLLQKKDLFFFLKKDFFFWRGKQLVLGDFSNGDGNERRKEFFIFLLFFFWSFTSLGKKFFVVESHGYMY